MNTNILSILFVIIWSSGFIIGRLIVDTVSPNIFLSIRFLGTAILFMILTRIYQKKYPILSEMPKHFLIGLLCNGLYLSGSYWAISKGMPAGIMALLGGLQPLMTLIVVSLFFKEKFNLYQFIGIMIGLFGVYLALPTIQNHHNLNYYIVLISFLSILSITLGLIFQKYKTKPTALIPALVIQNGAGALVASIMALILRENYIVFNFNFAFALFWAICVLSGLGIYILLHLTQKNSSVKTTSLLLLCPPLAAIQAKLLFNEHLTGLQIFGFFIALLGVFLCQKIKITKNC